MNIPATGDRSPRFSVVIPTYNRADVLGRAVRSVLAQTVTDLELVVVVDGSTDTTHEVLDAVRDARLHIVHQPNAGVSNARNTGIGATSGPLVTFIDDDDEADPRWVELLGACFDDPECLVACCGVQWPAKHDSLPHADRWFESDTLFASGTFMVRRTLLEVVGGFLDGLAFAENTELGFRLGDGVRDAGGRIAAVYERLVIRHPELSGTARIHKADAVLRVIEQHRERFSSDRQRLAQWLAIGGVSRARNHDLAGARRFFLKAWRTRPSDLKHLGRYAVTWIPSLPNRRWSLQRRVRQRRSGR